MQDQLARQQELLEVTQQLARVGTFEWDIVSGQLTWSDQMYKIFGLDRNAITISVETYFSHIHPEDFAKVQQGIETAVQNCAGFDMQERIIRPDGFMRVLRTSGRVVAGDSGQPVRMIGACMDVTEQSRSIDQLNASEARYRVLVDQASDSLVLHDERGVIIDANTTACRLLGYSREELIGQTPRLYNHEMSDGELQQLAQQLRITETATFEANHTDRNGRVFPVEVRLRAFLENGEPRAVSLVLDISERRQAEAARAANEQQLNRIGNTLPSGALVSLITDAQSRLSIQHVSAGFWPMLELLPDAPQAKLDEFVSRMPKKLLCKLRRAMRKSIVERTSIDEVIPLAEAVSRQRWLHVRCLPTDMGAGVTRWDGVVLDVTTQIHTQRALTESNEKYRIVTESLPQLIWIMRPDLTLEYVSPSAAEFTGRDLPSLSYDWNTIIHPDDLGLALEKLTHSWRTQQSTEAELRARRHDGQYRWMLARSLPLASGKGGKWLGAAIDIHDRKLAEQAREESEKRLQLLLHSVDLAVWEAEYSTHNFTYVSDFCEKLLGYSRAQWLEPNFWINHLHPDDVDQTLTDCRTACETGTDHRLEYRMLAADGRSVWLEDIVHVQVADGRVQSIRGVLQDISQRKLLEEQLRQSQKMEAIGRLAGGVAHDFNNILTVMMGYSELLLFTLPPNDANRSSISAINEAGKRAAALTRQLLTFSRKALVAPKVLDLNELVKSTENLLRPTIGEDIRLIINIDPRVRPIKADRVHIEQVLMNLAINARDAMPQGGTMIISTHDHVCVPNNHNQRLEDFVELALTDNGCGISEEMIGKIFDPFFTTKEVGRGTGLGLSVVHGVVTGAGGFIHVDSVVGQGTTFHLCFPATPSIPTSSSSAANVDYSRGAETILLVEDDRAVRAVTTATLSQQGYRVIDADSGEQALAEFRRAPERFDVVLTDVVMPGMSGRQLAEAIRQLRGNIPILFMSGHNDDAMLQHGIRSSGDAFIQKPFHPQSLGQKLRELLSNAGKS